MPKTYKAMLKARRERHKASSSRQQRSLCIIVAIGANILFLIYKMDLILKKHDISNGVDLLTAQEELNKTSKTQIRIDVIEPNNNNKEDIVDNKKEDIADGVDEPLERNTSLTPQQQAWLDFEAECGRKFTYVTARFHFQEGRWAEMIKNFRNMILDNGFPEERFYSYADRNFPPFIADDPRYREHLAFLDNPNDPSLRGAGYWFWKPILIQYHLNASQFGDFVVYSDVDDHTKDGAKFDRLKILARRMIENEDNDKEEWNMAAIRARDGLYTEKGLNKGATYKTLCPDRNHSTDESGQYGGGHLFIKKTAGTVEVINAWANNAANYYLINDVDKNHPDWPHVTDHRHDQAILSTILKCRYSADEHREFVEISGYNNAHLYLLALSPLNATTTAPDN